MARVATLLDLANMAIENPDIGVVNCRALHTLLHAILKHLNIEDEKVEIPEDWNMYKPATGSAKVEEVRTEAQCVDIAPVEDICLMEKHHASDDTVCRELIQKHCVPGLRQRSEIHNLRVHKTSKINLQLSNISDSIPERTDNGHMTVPRSCGGRHTLTVFQRYAKLQGITPSAQLENVMSGLKHQQVEGNIRGSDGKIYRGRMDAPLPPIHSKHGNSKFRGYEKSLPTMDIITVPHTPQGVTPTGHNSVRTNKAQTKQGNALRLREKSCV